RLHPPHDAGPACPRRRPHRGDVGDRGEPGSALRSPEGEANPLQAEPAEGPAGRLARPVRRAGRRKAAWTLATLAGRSALEDRRVLLLAGRRALVLCGDAVRLLLAGRRALVLRRHAVALRLAGRRALVPGADAPVASDELRDLRAELLGREAARLDRLPAGVA